MEYYLKDIGVYDMTSDKWTYFVQGDDRIAKVFPQNYQSPGQNAANTDLKVLQGMANFYEYDHLGNTRIVYSVRDIHNGTTNFDIHFAADYYPYGKTLRYFETAAFEEKFLTTQHERDRETGFDYRGARYYDSDLGRFLSLDPLAAQFPSWSAYNYVFGNPISLIDPDGRAPQDWVLKDNGTIYWDNNANDQAS
ncbi:RHS repeat-associated core domain-containing protein, partial [Wandonia haliotis]